VTQACPLRRSEPDTGFLGFYLGNRKWQAKTGQSGRNYFEPSSAS
jgi:hypothetical protein